MKTEELYTLADRAEERLREVFRGFERTSEINTRRVLEAFREYRVSEACFAGTTGYGYDDLGRETLEKIYARVFGAESALVRTTFVNGTHAIACALYGALRPGDTILSVTGAPYDTLRSAITGTAHGSLASYGVRYAQLELSADGGADMEKIRETVSAMRPRAVYLQRSRGYAPRRALFVEEIGAVAGLVKSVSPDTVVITDNCYGEFTDTAEPCAAGADLIAGSLIKNPGGGIAPTGGYIAGRKKLVEDCSYRLTTPGTGKEIGCTLNQSRELFMGAFNAPHVTGEALKTAVFAAVLFEQLGFEVTPKYDEIRGDIIQAILLGNEERLIKFCQGIQAASPIDSFVTPEPWDMPGYDSKVIMAAGAFTLGSSIELSADAPLREPYAVWMQGGLNFHSGKTAVLLAAEKMKGFV